MCGTAPRRLPQLVLAGDLRGDVGGRSAFDIAQAIQPKRTNSTAPTAMKAAAPGNAVSWNIAQPMTTVDGMVITQATHHLTDHPEVDALTRSDPGAGDRRRGRVGGRDRNAQPGGTEDGRHRTDVGGQTRARPQAW